MVGGRGCSSLPSGLRSSEKVMRAMTVQEQTRVGDVVATDLRNPVVQTLRMTLETLDACRYADRLLASPENGWRLEHRGPVDLDEAA
jgi:hypothetical protein